MANKEMTSSTTASIRAESNQPENASVPASILTNYSVMPPSSVSTTSSPRRTRQPGQSAQGAPHFEEDSRPQADDLLFGIGNSFKPSASSLSSSSSLRPARKTGPPKVHDPDGADAQDAMPQQPQPADELTDTLKRMHSDNMMARKRRRESAQAQASTAEPGGNSNSNGDGDHNANANTGASPTTTTTTTSKPSPDSKHHNAGLPRRSKPE